MRTGLITALLFSTMSSAAAQTPAPAVDPTPMARLLPFATVGDSSPASVAAKIVAILNGEHFTIDKFDEVELTVDATRWDGTGPRDGYDRFLIWLERDPSRPQERVRIYLMYGRFEFIMGRNSGTQRSRVVVDGALEHSRVGTVEQAIVKLAITSRSTPP